MSLSLVPETGLTTEETLLRLVRAVNNIIAGNSSELMLQDNVPAPQYAPGKATIYVDVADGDLKVKFGDGTTKTLSVDT